MQKKRETCANLFNAENIRMFMEVRLQNKRAPFYFMQLLQSFIFLTKVRRVRRFHRELWNRTPFIVWLVMMNV